MFTFQLNNYMSNALIIIPTYNERENIEAIVTAIFNLKNQYHILVVDDSSPDGTGTIVKDLMGKHPNQLFLETRTKKNGLGKAYIHGFEWALEKGYEYIMQMDADFSHNPKDLERLLDACENEGADLAIGSRYSKGVNVVNWPMKRVLLSFFASRYVRVVTGIPIHDTTAGFACWRRKTLETINLKKIRFVGYAFQIEMKFKAWKHQFNIKEVSVIFTDRTKGTSKMSGNIVYEALFGVIKMRLKGLPKN